MEMQLTVFHGEGGSFQIQKERSHMGRCGYVVKGDLACSEKGPDSGHLG